MFTSALVTALGIGLAFLFPVVKLLLDMVGVLILFFMGYGILRLVIRVFLPKKQNRDG